MEQYDRALLLEQVWTDPMTAVALHYGLSDVGLKKLCARLQIPTPMRGYWAKFKAGKRVPSKPKLKDYTGQPNCLWHSSAPPRQPKPTVIESVDPRLEAILRYEKQPGHAIRVAERLTHPHRYVVQTREALLRPVVDQRGMPSPRRSEQALNIKVSAALQCRALRIADALIKACETRGYAVVVGERTQVEILGISISLRFFESTKRSEPGSPPRTLVKAERRNGSSMSTPQYLPTGLLQVLADEGYGGKITDTANRRVEQQLNTLISRMAQRAVEFLVGREERAVADVERRKQHDAALALKAQQDGERKKLQELEDDANNWRRASALREYLDGLEKSIYGAGAPTEQQVAYLRWARAKADWLDPLNLQADELLDHPIDIPSHYGW
ncbi:hypothetical protein ACQKP5_12405 [Pseudomonas vancouverensis]|uniref:hypothetical protein n=1 Tax=Pseudomonas vancouverensis TaxID=95300 RepID=UPI003D00FD36